MNLPTIYHPPRPADIKTALWISFWLAVLTAGQPDLLDAIIGLIGRLA